MKKSHLEYEHNGVTVVNRGGNTSAMSMPYHGGDDDQFEEHMIIEEGDGAHEVTNSNYMNFREDGKDIETERFDNGYIESNEYKDNTVF